MREILVPAPQRRHEQNHEPIIGDEEPEAEENPPDHAGDTPPLRLQRHLLRLHRNLGHPSPREFARALSHAGVKPELVRWARHHLRCSVCHERRHYYMPHLCRHRAYHLTH